MYASEYVALTLQWQEVYTLHPHLCCFNVFFFFFFFWNCYILFICGTLSLIPVCLCHEKLHNFIVKIICKISIRITTAFYHKCLYYSTTYAIKVVNCWNLLSLWVHSQILLMFSLSLSLESLKLSSLLLNSSTSSLDSWKSCALNVDGISIFFEIKCNNKSNKLRQNVYWRSPSYR